MDKEQRGNWIHIGEGCPDKVRPVLVKRRNGSMNVAFFSSLEGWDNFYGDDTKWQIIAEGIQSLDDHCESCSLYDEVIYITINDVIWWQELPEEPKYINTKG